MDLELNGEKLTIEDVVAVARSSRRVKRLSQATRSRVQAARDWVADSLTGENVTIYGVNTGFGPLATKKIEPEELRQLSRNVVLACVTGVGKPLRRDLARAMMLIRANTFALGLSGVRPVVIDTLIEMLNAGVVPVVPEKGSLGASGDLAPLAHIAVVLSQDPSQPDESFSGMAWYQDDLLSGADAMARAGIARLELEAKEGLALTNGTNLMAAAGSLGVYDADNLLRHAEVAAALSMEALLGLSEALHPALHSSNNQPGQIKTAARIRDLIQGSELIDSIPSKVQDAYSIRCTPQVLGPVRDVLDFIRQRFSDVLGAASDNPLIFANSGDSDAGIALSGGNFHGQGLSLWLDLLGLAMASIGNIAERRIFRLTAAELNEGLPSMLVARSGLDSGLMMPQYTAAALVADNKVLAHPSSVDSIPTSGNQEDFVSMGANAARHALEIIENVRHIIAIEFITAAQAVDLRQNGPRRLGRGTRIAYELIRSQVPFLERDRALAPDIQAVSELIMRETIIDSIQESIDQNTAF